MTGVQTCALPICRIVEENVRVKLSERAAKYIVKEGFSDEYGARPLRRLVQDSVENLLAEYLLTHRLGKKKIKMVNVDVVGGKMKIIDKS